MAMLRNEAAKALFFDLPGSLRDKVTSQNISKYRSDPDARYGAVVADKIYSDERLNVK